MREGFILNKFYKSKNGIRFVKDKLITNGIFYSLPIIDPETSSG